MPLTDHSDSLVTRNLTVQDSLELDLDTDVEVKEMTAPHALIRAFGETWVATESTMKDLRQRTSSSIYIDDLDTDPQFHKKVFAVSRLAQGH